MLSQEGVLATGGEECVGVQADERISAGAFTAFHALEKHDLVISGESTQHRHWRLQVRQIFLVNWHNGPWLACRQFFEAFKTCGKHCVNSLVKSELRKKQKSPTRLVAAG
jgi:hypothetical protein